MLATSENIRPGKSPNNRKETVEMASRLLCLVG